jgi:hypothetical protein
MRCSVTEKSAMPASHALGGISTTTPITERHDSLRGPSLVQSCSA